MKHKTYQKVVELFIYAVIKLYIHKIGKPLTFLLDIHFIKYQSSNSGGGFIKTGCYPWQPIRF